METSSDYSDESEIEFDLNTHKKFVEDCVNFLKEHVHKIYEYYEGRIEAYKKEVDELKAKLEGKEEEEEEEDVAAPLYQIGAVVAYTMDRAYYNKCHNDAKAILDDRLMWNFNVFKEGKPPIYISIEDQTLKLGKYDIVKNMKRAAKIMHNFKKSVKLVNKHTLNILKAYAEEISKGDNDNKKLEMFNHMFED